MEHLIATYLRNSEIKDDIIYFGPMGCRTGCYLLVKGKRTPYELAPYLKQAFLFVLDFEGEIPGQKPEECGNWLDHNIYTSKYLSLEYIKVLDSLDEQSTTYPELTD